MERNIEKENLVGCILQKFRKMYDFLTEKPTEREDVFVRMISFIFIFIVSFFLFTSWVSENYSAYNDHPNGFGEESLSFHICNFLLLYLFFKVFFHITCGEDVKTKIKRWKTKFQKQKWNVQRETEFINDDNTIIKGIYNWRKSKIEKAEELLNDIEQQHLTKKNLEGFASVFHYLLSVIRFRFLAAALTTIPFFTICMNISSFANLMKTVEYSACRFFERVDLARWRFRNTWRKKIGIISNDDNIELMISKLKNCGIENPEMLVHKLEKIADSQENQQRSLSDLDMWILLFCLLILPLFAFLQFCHFASGLAALGFIKLTFWVLKKHATRVRRSLRNVLDTILKYDEIIKSDSRIINGNDIIKVEVLNGCNEKEMEKIVKFMNIFVEEHSKPEPFSSYLVKSALELKKRSEKQRFPENSKMQTQEVNSLQNLLNELLTRQITREDLKILRQKEKSIKVVEKERIHATDNIDTKAAKEPENDKLINQTKNDVSAKFQLLFDEIKVASDNMVALQNEFGLILESLEKSSLRSNSSHEGVEQNVDEEIVENTEEEKIDVEFKEEKEVADEKDKEEEGEVNEVKIKEEEEEKDDEDVEAEEEEEISNNNDCKNEEHHENSNISYDETRNGSSASNSSIVENLELMNDDLSKETLLRNGANNSHDKDVESEDDKQDKYVYEISSDDTKDCYYYIEYKCETCKLYSRFDVTLSEIAHTDRLNLNKYFCQNCKDVSASDETFSANIDNDPEDKDENMFVESAHYNDDSDADKTQSESVCVISRSDDVDAGLSVSVDKDKIQDCAEICDDDSLEDDKLVEEESYIFEDDTKLKNKNVESLSDEEEWLLV